MVQNDVTHPAAQLHAECLAYWWPSRSPVLRAGSTEAFSVTGSGPRIAAVSTGTCFAWRPHAASLPTTRKCLAGVLNPWAGTGEDGRADPLHPDWNEVGERDVERLRALEPKCAERPESLDGSAHVGRESHRAECLCSRGLGCPICSTLTLSRSEFPPFPMQDSSEADRQQWSSAFRSATPTVLVPSVPRARNGRRFQ